MSNFPRYLYPPPPSQSHAGSSGTAPSDSTAAHGRLRVTQEGIEPLLFMIVHTIEFLRTTHVCVEALEAEARIFGGLTYPRVRENHPTINVSVNAAVEEAKALPASTSSTASNSHARFATSSATASAASGYSTLGTSHPSQRSRANLLAPVVQPPAVLSPREPPSALHFLAQSLGRPFSIQVSIGRIERGWITSRRTPIEQWVFQCLKTAHPHYISDDNTAVYANDIAQGRALLRFILDTSFGSTVASPAADGETFFKAKNEELYFDVQILKDPR